MKLSVVLPAYNEEDTIGRVLDAVLHVDLSSLPERVEIEVVAVDDASSDGTADILRRYDERNERVRFVRHDRNLGKGCAIRTALAHATGDVVLIQDADLEYSVEDYPALLRPFIECKARVVYGSRFLKRRRPRGMRTQNYLANRVLTALANLLYRMKITDEATCYKLFRADLLRSLPLKARGFDFCPEVTSLVRLRGVRIHEVPIEYSGRSVKEGKKINWADGVRAIWTLLRYRIAGEKGGGARSS